MDVSKFTEPMDRQSDVLCDNSMQFGEPFNGFIPVNLQAFKPGTDTFDSSCICISFCVLLLRCTSVGRLWVGYWHTLWFVEYLF
jgi:hypothetical protein